MAEEENVPTYTETDDGGLASWIDALDEEQTALLELPLTRWPYPTHPAAHWVDLNPPTNDTTPGGAGVGSGMNVDEINTLQARLITTLFEAVRSKNDELATLLVRRGWVSPDVPDARGETPLLAAIGAGNGAMVCTLIGLGASVNRYGTGPGPEGGERTPLMAAAAAGRLALVKLLMEDFGADDAVIAPDGQLALRLAADAGHREVVAYLPSRRGGAWRRWQVQHAVAVRRVKKSAANVYAFFRFFLWSVPRTLLWDCPKHALVLPAWRGCKKCWVNRGKIARWCKLQAKEMPGRTKRAAAAVWRGAKKVPVAVWKVAKEVPGEAWRALKAVPGLARRLAAAFWRFVKRIPGVMKLVAVWIWESLKRVGAAVGSVFLRVVSALHTAVMAVLDFFRSITLKDVSDAVQAVFRAIFVDLPKAIWKGIEAVGDVSYKVLKGLFGIAGQVIWWIFCILVWVAVFVPSQLWKMICAIASSMAKGYHEILVWFNPKH